MGNKRKEKPNGPEDGEGVKKQKASIPISRGRFKQKWLSKHSSLLKRSDSASGVLVSCDIRAETRALGQVGNALHRYVDLLFPDCETTWTRFEGDFEIADIDDSGHYIPKCDTDRQKDTANTVATQTGKEDAQTAAIDTTATNTPERRERKFQAVDTACGGVLFYRFRINVTPTVFLKKLFDHLTLLPKEEKEQALHTLRHTSRWIPLDFICPATTDRIQKCFEQVQKAHLDAKEPTTQTVAILTEIRNNPTIKKEDIIQTIAPMIPPHYRVDLKHATLVIIVTVIKSVCGMSVLENYYEKKRYNLLSLLQ